MRRLLPLIVLAILVGMATGCDQYNGDKNKSCYTSLDEEGWAYGQTVDFKIGMPKHLTDTARIQSDPNGVEVFYNPSDSIIKGSMVVSLRHTSDYPYANLWLEVKYVEPITVKVNDSVFATVDSMMCDTVNIMLADSYGIWHGTGLGSTCQLSDTILRGVTVRRTEPVQLRHIMRVDTLRGLQQIGLQIIQ